MLAKRVLKIFRRNIIIRASMSNIEALFQNHIEINLKLDHLYFHYVQGRNVGLIRACLFSPANYKLPAHEVEKHSDSGGPDFLFCFC